ncbi:MAG: ABC transporter permease, partial [Gemmatimonadetes bacterium]|nr:ABC transporter permease [Gemmatimonadota bacterium]
MREWREEVRRRLARAKLDGASEHDIVEELAQHLQDRYAELLARGVAAADARAEVLAELGEDDALAQHVGGAVRARPAPLPIGQPTFGGRVGGVWSDVRFGVRMLLRTPIYAGFAVLVLALGIGANTAIFTVVNSVLLQPPAGVHEPDRLAGVFTSDYSGPLFGSSSYPDVEAMREAGSIFEDVAGYSLQTFSMVGDGWSARGMGEFVSASYFRVLGVRPAIGRFFSADEADPGRTASVTVIGHELWQTYFGGRADALGAKILVKGQPLTVIGVAPRDFGGTLRGLRAQVWLPLSAPRNLTGVDPSHRGNRGLQVRARLREGVSIEAAQRTLDVLASRLHGEFPDEWTNVDGRSRVFTILPESDVRVLPQMRGAVFGGLGVLMAAVFTVLLIACTNVANLMLSRASVRRAEMGIRVALGATRGRIVRHLLAESLLLASIGGGLGLLLAVWLMSMLQAVRLPGLHITIQVGLDWRVLAFATAITVATSLVFGLAPALQASRSPAPLLKDDARSGARTRLRNALIVVQVACSMVLLIGGGLLLRSLREMQTIDTGYATDNVVLARFELDAEGYSPEQAAAFYDELLRRAGALPGTTSRTLAEDLPLGMGWSRRSVIVDGYQPEAGEDMEVLRNAVGPDYFSTMGITLRRGRDFTASDRTGAPPVVIVSEAFARRFWPGRDPIGMRVGIAGPDAPFAEVIGIAPDRKYRSFDEEPQPFFYLPYLQHPSSTMVLLARTTGDPAALVAGLRDAIHAFAPSLPAPQVLTFRQHLALSTLPQRVGALLLSGLGLLAVVIAVIGLYGIIAFGVAQRAREFGIRMALGAAAADVRRLVTGNALRLVGIGIACGAPLALAAAFLMRSFLLVPPVDPVT